MKARARCRLAAWLVALAIAGTTTGTATNAHALASCSIVSTSGVGFGNYKPQDNTPLDSTGLVSFQCTGVTAGDLISIHLSRGRAGVFQPRTMTAASGTLEYNLFLDAARTVVWGDGSNATSTFMAVPLEGGEVSVPVYGRVNPRQSVAVGTYGDLIVVTLNY